MLGRQNADYAEKNKRQDARAVSPFDPFTANNDMDTTATDKVCSVNDTHHTPLDVPLVFRLTTATAVLPFLHHCRWRRALGRRRTTSDVDAITDGRATRVMPNGGMIRAAPTRTNELNIPRHWRVSHLYERRYQSNTRLNASTPYLYSRERETRMAYCTSIRKVLDPQDVETILYDDIDPNTSKTGRAWIACGHPRTLCGPPPRGKRDGLPAGPGLPNGDCTGDDD